MRVVFPAPLGPNTPKDGPGGNLKVDLLEHLFGGASKDRCGRPCRCPLLQWLLA